MAATAHDDALARLVQVRQQRFTVLGHDLGTKGNLDYDVRSACAGAVAAGTVAALGCAEMLGVAKIYQGVEFLRRNKDHVAALAPITAVGATELHELFAPERDNAVSAVAGAEIDLGLVKELHFGSLETEKGRLAPTLIWCGLRAEPTRRQ